MYKNPAAGEVGIFWIHGNQLIQNSISWRDAAWVDINGDRIHDFPVDHYRHWERLKKISHTIADIEYDEIPRGRVIYNETERTFYIYTTNHIIKGKKSRRDMIKRGFSLIGKKAVFRVDSHY